MIRRRHVFYIAGFDPQGVPGYYRLFRRELARFLKLWPVNASLSEPELDDAELSARWRIEMAGPNWCVETTYEFLRWDDIVARDSRRSIFVRLPRILSCLVENALNGTTYRVLRASWRYGVFYLGSAVLLEAAYTAVIVLGWLTYLFTRDTIGRGIAVSFGVAVVVGGILSALAHYLCARWLVTRLLRSVAMAAGLGAWTLPRFCCAHRRFRAPDHCKSTRRRCRRSAGGRPQCGRRRYRQVIARALELDPDFARAGSRSPWRLSANLPLAAFHPNAHDVREAIRRVAIEPSLVWVDCQALGRAEFFRTATWSRVSAPTPGRNNAIRYTGTCDFATASPPILPPIPLEICSRALSFIMANDQRAPYDYFMIACGPSSACSTGQRMRRKHWLALRRMQDA